VTPAPSSSHRAPRSTRVATCSPPGAAGDLHRWPTGSHVLREIATSWDPPSTTGTRLLRVRPRCAPPGARLRERCRERVISTRLASVARKSTTRPAHAGQRPIQSRELPEAQWRDPHRQPVICAIPRRAPEEARREREKQLVDQPVADELTTRDGPALVRIACSPRAEPVQQHATGARCGASPR